VVTRRLTGGPSTSSAAKDDEENDDEEESGDETGHKPLLKQKKGIDPNLPVHNLDDEPEKN
jgi:hypothetical protein